MHEAAKNRKMRKRNVSNKRDQEGQGLTGMENIRFAYSVLQ